MVARELSWRGTGAACRAAIRSEQLGCRTRRVAHSFKLAGGPTNPILSAPFAHHRHPSDIYHLIRPKCNLNAGLGRFLFWMGRKTERGRRRPCVGLKVRVWVVQLRPWPPSRAAIAGLVSRKVARTLVVLAAYRRVEWRENSVRIIPINPHVAVKVRHEHMSFVDRRGGVINHAVVGHAVETWRGTLAACRLGGGV